MRIVLCGWLGREYGASHQFCVKTAAEAILILDANYSGFFDSITHYPYGFVFVCQNRVLARNELMLHLPDDALYIVPVIGGSDPIITPIATALASAGMTGTIMGVSISYIAASIVVGVAFSMIMSGIMSLLAPSPPDGTGKTKEMRSYDFDGPISQMRQGYPVPIGYGELFVGDIPISVYQEITYTDDKEGVTDDFAALKARQYGQ